MPREVASRIGVDNSTLTGWERSQHEPAVEHVPRIFTFLSYEPGSPSASLGEQLRAARRRRGLTYSQLADRLGVNHVHLVPRNLSRT